MLELHQHLRIRNIVAGHAQQLCVVNVFVAVDTVRIHNILRACLSAAEPDQAARAVPQRMHAVELVAHLFIVFAAVHAHQASAGEIALAVAGGHIEFAVFEKQAVHDFVDDALFAVKALFPAHAVQQALHTAAVQIAGIKRHKGIGEEAIGVGRSVIELFAVGAEVRIIAADVGDQFGQVRAVQLHAVERLITVPMDGSLAVSVIIGYIGTSFIAVIGNEVELAVDDIEIGVSAIISIRLIDHAVHRLFRPDGIHTHRALFAQLLPVAAVRRDADQRIADVLVIIVVRRILLRDIIQSAVPEVQIYGAVLADALGIAVLNLINAVLLRQIDDAVFILDDAAFVV